MPAERLANADAFLLRTDLRALGLERRAVDAVFRACPVVVLPGYSRPLIHVSDYSAFITRTRTPMIAFDRRRRLRVGAKSAEGARSHTAGLDSTDTYREVAIVM